MKTIRNLLALFAALSLNALAQPITQLPAASALGGTEVGAFVQSATAKKVTVDQIKTYVNTGVLSNPMTTGGDIIYGGASGAATRLANGSAGQVLTSAGTTAAPTWQTPSVGYTDEQAQDAIGAMVDTTLVYVDGTPLLTRGAITGDVSIPQASNTSTLATVNSNVGSFGSATTSLTATVNAKGLITALSAQTVTPAVGSITGLGTNVATALGNTLNAASGLCGYGGTCGALTLTTPIATSLALGGATIGSNALAVTGAVNISGNTTIGGVVLHADGTKSAPSFAFTSSATNGFYYRSGIAVGITGISREIVQIGTGGNIFSGGNRFGLTSSGSGDLSISGADTFLSATAAATWQLGSANVTSGAIAQTLTAQGNDGSTTNGPLLTIRGASGGSSTSVGGELRLVGGLSSAAAGTGGSVTVYTAPAGAGATPALALTIDSTKLATFAGAITGSGNVNFTYQNVRAGVTGSYFGMAAIATTASANTTGNIVGLGSNTTLGWAASTDATAVHTSALSQISAGLIGVGTGAAGSFAGGLKLTTLIIAQASPAAAGACAAGTITADTGFLYVCSSTGDWRRVAVATY